MVVIVRECKCVVCVVILQPLTVLPETLSAACSPAGFVGVGVILSTAFPAVALRRNHFAAAGSHLVFPSPSLWSDKAPQPFYLVMKASPEFQYRVPGEKERFQQNLKVDVAFLQIDDNVLEAAQGFLSCSSFSHLSCSCTWENLSVSPKICPFQADGSRGRMSPAGVHQTGFVVLLQSRFLWEVGGG